MAKADRRMKRWQEQRWILDAVIRTVGVEWDQSRLRYSSAPAGAEAAAAFQATGARIRRIADFDREFAASARRREARAEQYEADGRQVAARENYLIAALFWAAARWPIFEVTDTLVGFEERMNHCYGKFIQFAPHPIEAVRVPLGDKAMPAYLHLPHEAADGTAFPCVINIPGMDSSKETGVLMYGDPYLQRGIAVLSIDGPGQGECCTLGIHVTENNHMEAGIAAFEFLAAHPAIDTGRIAIRGTSFGTFWGTQAAAVLGDRIKGCAVSGVCQEPGCNTIFNMASPSFKLRYMFMAGIEDEDAFDRFAERLDLRPIAGDIKCPYMVVAGEADQLSPVECTYELFDLITAPKRLVVYQGANHSVADATSASLGESRHTLMADWLLDRLDGRPMTSERVFVDSAGNAHVTAVA